MIIDTHPDAVNDLMLFDILNQIHLIEQNLVSKSDLQNFTRKKASSQGQAQYSDVLNLTLHYYYFHFESRTKSGVF